MNYEKLNVRGKYKQTNKKKSCSGLIYNLSNYEKVREFLSNI